MDMAAGLSTALVGLAIGSLAGFAFWGVGTELALLNPRRDVLGGYTTQFRAGCVVFAGLFFWALSQLPLWLESHLIWVIVALLGVPLALLVASIGFWLNWRYTVSRNYENEPRKAWWLGGSPIIGTIQLGVSVLVLSSNSFSNGASTLAT